MTATSTPLDRALALAAELRNEPRPNTFFTIDRGDTFTPRAYSQASSSGEALAGVRLCSSLSVQSADIEALKALRDAFAEAVALWQAEADRQAAAQVNAANADLNGDGGGTLPQAFRRPVMLPVDAA